MACINYPRYKGRRLKNNDDANKNNKNGNTNNVGHWILMKTNEGIEYLIECIITYPQPHRFTEITTNFW